MLLKVLISTLHQWRPHVVAISKTSLRVIKVPRDISWACLRISLATVRGQKRRQHNEDDQWRNKVKSTLWTKTNSHQNRFPILPPVQQLFSHFDWFCFSTVLQKTGWKLGSGVRVCHKRAQVRFRAKTNKEKWLSGVNGFIWGNRTTRTTRDT